MRLRIIHDIEYFLLDANYSTLGMRPKVYPKKLILREVRREKKKFCAGNPVFYIPFLCHKLV